MLLKKLLFFLIYIVQFTPLYGKTFRSIQNGCWDSPLTWDLNLVPLYIDTVIVSHTVKFDRSIVLHQDALLQIDSNGYLQGESDISLTCGTTLINYGKILCSIFDLNGDGANYGFINALSMYHVNSCYSPYIHGTVHIGAVSDSLLQIFQCSLLFNNISVFPNPANDHIAIKFLLKTKSFILIDLLSINGQIIKSQVIDGLFPDYHELNYLLPKLPNGVYILRILIEGVTLNKQIIISRND